MEINKNNLEAQAISVNPDDFKIPKMKEGVVNYLELLRAIHDGSPDETIRLKKISRLAETWEVDDGRLEILREKIHSGKPLVIEVQFNLIKKVDGKTENKDVNFRVGFLLPKNKTSCVETYHRRGMSVPKGPGRRLLNGGITAAVCVDDEFLADLLNLCEGKAHLSWGRSENIKKLLEERYLDGTAVRDLCALSLKDLYQAIMETGAELDSSIWADLFQAPTKPKPGPDDDDDDLVEPPPSSAPTTRSWSLPLRGDSRWIWH